MKLKQIQQSKKFVGRRPTTQGNYKKTRNQEGEIRQKMHGLGLNSSVSEIPASHSMIENSQQ
jgi:hypothetical protein